MTYGLHLLTQLLLEFGIRCINIRMKILFNFSFEGHVILEDSCNMSTYSGEGTQERALNDLLCLV